MKADQLLIFDTSLRDGEQAPGCSMRPEEKLTLAHQLAELGVDIIEAGFPAASEGDAEGVRRIAAEVRGPVIAALARCFEQDIDTAWKSVDVAEQPRIHTFLATSDIHLAYKLNMTHDQALQQVATMVRHARSLCSDIEFSPEDATRSDVGFLCEVLEAAVEAGATTLNIPDTVGYTTQTDFSALIKAIRDRVKGVDGIVLSVHCHDDLGMAVANSLAGVEAGARQVECTINGIGERAGNASLEEIAMALHVRRDHYRLETGIQHQEIYATSQLLAKLIGFEPQPNKAIVGRNAFAHEAGIHQHGVLNNPLCYEIMNPETVGVPADRIILGKHSGRHALAFKYKELGYDLSSAEINRIYPQFIHLADRKKRVYEQDLLTMLQRQQPAAGEYMPRQQLGML